MNERQKQEQRIQQRLAYEAKFFKWIEDSGLKPLTRIDLNTLLNRLMDVVGDPVIDTDLQVIFRIYYREVQGKNQRGLS